MPWGNILGILLFFPLPRRHPICSPRLLFREVSFQTALAQDVHLISNLPLENGWTWPDLVRHDLAVIFHSLYSIPTSVIDLQSFCFVGITIFEASSIMRRSSKPSRRRRNGAGAGWCHENCGWDLHGFTGILQGWNLINLINYISMMNGDLRLTKACQIQRILAEFQAVWKHSSQTATAPCQAKSVILRSQAEREKVVKSCTWNQSA
jgi:hypothetical protein